LVLAEAINRPVRLENGGLIEQGPRKSSGGRQGHSSAHAAPGSTADRGERRDRRLSARGATRTSRIRCLHSLTDLAQAGNR